MLLILVFACSAKAQAPSFEDLKVLDQQSRDIDPKNLSSELRLGQEWTCAYRSRFLPNNAEDEILSYEIPKIFKIVDGVLHGTDPESLYAIYTFNTQGQLERGKGYLDALYPEQMRTPRLTRRMLGHLGYPHKEIVRRLPKALLIRLHYMDGIPSDWIQSYLYCTLGDVSS